MEHKIDFLEHIFHMESEQNFVDLHANAKLIVDKFFQTFPLLPDFTRTAFQRVLDVRDTELMQLIVLIAIPSIADVTVEARNTCPDQARFDAFLAELIACRSNWLDGLAETGVPCLAAVGAQFSSLRDFVVHMRLYYLLHSKPDDKARQTVPEPHTRRRDAADYLRDAGSLNVLLWATTIAAALRQDYDVAMLSPGGATVEFGDPSDVWHVSYKPMAPLAGESKQVQEHVPVFADLNTLLKSKPLNVKPVITLGAPQKPDEKERCLRVTLSPARLSPFASMSL